MNTFVSPSKKSDPAFPNAPGGPLTARSIDMVYKAGIDMVDTFHFILGRFQAYVVEKILSSGATAEVCKVGVSVPTRPVAVVSEVWLQPLGGLQVEAALRANRARGPARSGTAAAPLAAADSPGVA